MQKYETRLGVSLNKKIKLTMSPKWQKNKCQKKGEFCYNFILILFILQENKIV
jgi:hypothetical protein